MDISQKILSDMTVYMKYAKYIPELKRRETWEEIVLRNKTMHLKKFPNLKNEIDDAYEFVYDKRILPSMRSMQFAGTPMEVNNARMFNCSYQPIDDYRAFSEGMFLLLSGCGYGYSVQKYHVEKLPEIRKPVKSRRYVIGDSIHGWADAVKVLINSYFTGKAKPNFDFTDIRAKGTALITSGGKAPGPEPLKRCLFEVEQVLDNKTNGSKLTPLECHSIMCYIADSVLAGGIRRSAMISLFSFDDEEMISCKSGKWYELNPHFARANNSVVIVNDRIKRREFDSLWEKIIASNAGEPGFYFTYDPEYGTNPCCETSLRPHTFCNLVEVSASGIVTQDDFNKRVRAAAFINTLQSSYTDFYYLRDIWKKNTEKDALIGVGITGIGNGNLEHLDKEEAAQIVLNENERVAKLTGINPAARATVVKPAGTTSIVVATSSGIHAWHNTQFIRRLRVGKNEAIYTYILNNHPELVEDCISRPHDTAIISVPLKAPKGAFLRTESALTLLDRVRTYNTNWVRAGHRKGPNYHNVSATITIKPNEWDNVGDWIWDNKHLYHGLSILPHSDHTYRQAPFEDCTEEEHDRLFKSLQDIDLSAIIEEEDDTDLSGEMACAGGSCELN